MAKGYPNLSVRNVLVRESLANAKVSARQQCV